MAPFEPSQEPDAEPAPPEPFEFSPTEISSDPEDETDAAGLSLSDLPSDLAAEAGADAPADAEKGKSEEAQPDPALLEAARLRRPAHSGGTIALVVLAASVFGLALWIDTARARRLNAPLPAPEEAMAAAPSSPAPVHEPTAAPEPLPFQPEPHPVPASGPAGKPAAAAAALPAPRSLDANILRAQRLERERLRRSAEDLRLQAGLARVAAQRVDGEANAQETFGEAAGRERQGELLFRSGRFDDARDAFADAARLYREAETVSHEERVKRVRLSPAP